MTHKNRGDTAGLEIRPPDFSSSLVAMSSFFGGLDGNVENPFQSITAVRKAFRIENVRSERVRLCAVSINTLSLSTVRRLYKIVKLSK